MPIQVNDDHYGTEEWIERALGALRSEFEGQVPDGLVAAQRCEHRNLGTAYRLTLRRATSRGLPFNVLIGTQYDDQMLGWQFVGTITIKGGKTWTYFGFGPGDYLHEEGSSRDWAHAIVQKFAEIATDLDASQSVGERVALIV